MGYLPFLLYILSFFAGLGSVYVAFKLQKKYPIKYLSYYLYFLISFYLLGFLNLIARQLTLDSVGTQAPEIIERLVYLMAFLSIPFFVLSIYLFVLFVQELLGRRLSSLFAIGYIILWSIFFMVLVFSMKNYFDTNNDQYVRVFFPYLNLLGIVSFLIIPLYLFFSVRRLQQSPMNGVIRNLALLYTVIFVICTFLSSDPGLKILGKYGVYIAILFYFAENWPPLLYLKSSLKKYYVEPPAQPVFDLDLSSFYREFQISAREREIITQILRGNSNIEIEKELFISLHTVKNHIYNIYQKLGVKSRLHLTNFIREYIGNNKAPEE